MCNSVRYLDRVYATPAELAQLVGGQDRIVRGDSINRDVSNCLCPVDLEATLERAGFDWHRGVDPMEWTAYKGK